mgnify:CR=1 FL=1
MGRGVPFMSWQEIPRAQLAAWNQRLLREPTASIRQYPLLNEGHRLSGHIWINFVKPYSRLIEWCRRQTTTTRYLAYRSGGDLTSYAVVVGIGMPGLRLGCIVDGPVTFAGRQMEPREFSELLNWARRNHYLAIRVTHPDPEYVDYLATLGEVERTDGVPFYPHPFSELFVDLSPDDEAVLASFQTVARRNIRQAREAGYHVSIDRKAGALERAWSVFEARSAQKQLNYRSLKMWKLIMNEAEPYHAAHVYTAWRNAVPIASILVLRDHTTAHNLIGAIDRNALGDAPSPACLLHWSAMQHAKRLGCRYYNLGTRSGSVYTFKAKFRPVERHWPLPATFIIRPSLYHPWRRMLPTVTRFIMRQQNATGPAA